MVTIYGTNFWNWTGTDIFGNSCGSTEEKIARQEAQEASEDPYWKCSPQMTVIFPLKYCFHDFDTLHFYFVPKIQQKKMICWN